MNAALCCVHDKPRQHVVRPDALTAGTLAENGPFCSFPNAGSVQQAYLLERLSLIKVLAQRQFRISMQAFWEFRT